jgi:Lipase (class 3)
MPSEDLQGNIFIDANSTSINHTADEDYHENPERSATSSSAREHRAASGPDNNTMEYNLPLNDVHTPKSTEAASGSGPADFHGNNSSSSQFSFSPHPSHGNFRQRTLLEEIREVLAQSYLIFLMADLRLMSGTGRIGTLYEYLAIDSDVYPKHTAAQLACMVLPSDEYKEEEEKREENPYYSYETDKSTMVAKGPEHPTKSLSPANIMAILLLEIRDTFVHAAGADENPEVGQALMTYREDKAKRRDLEDSMTSLLRAYARMISGDLVAEIPTVRRRRMSMAHSGTVGGSPRPFPTTPNPNVATQASMQDSQPQFRASSLGLASIREETSFDMMGNTAEFREDSLRIGGKDKDESSKSTQSQDSKPPTASSDITKAEEEKARDSKEGPSLDSETIKAKSEDSLRPEILRINSADSDADDKPATNGRRHPLKLSLVSSPPNPFSSARREQLVHQVSQRKEQLAEEAKQFAANMKQKRQTMVQEINDRVDPNREGNAQKEFQELTHALFEEGGENKEVMSSLGGNVAPREMLSVMRRAVETRNDGQLQFLSRIFKEGSVSQLLVESHSRLVWMNDWYPLKDLTYAIAVDTRLKRVLVVFRGAITTQDWRTVMHYSMETIPNPVKEDFEGKKDKIRVFSGFYEYLFRVRKDTGTTKYSEIASLAHKYGMEKVGKDYKLFVTGHSLGGALTNFFCFFASTEERFTRNGPVQAIAFAGPYCGGHSFADAFRHQERNKKLQFIRVANDNDMVPRLPMNFRIGRRGCRWRHVGIGVTMPNVPLFGKWKPLMHYYGKEKSWFGSTVHGYKRNFLFHTPMLRPWTIARMHTLFELQDRLMYGELQSNPGGDFTMLNQTMDELYKGLEEEDFQKLKGMKTKQKWR